MAAGGNGQWADPDGDVNVLGRLGMYDIETPEGAQLAMALPLDPRITNNRGGIQGGLLATLVDVVAGRAVTRGLGERQSAATADLNIHFLNAVTVGPAHAVARVVRWGKSLVVAQVEVRDEGRDVLAAIATLTFVVVALRPDQLSARDLGAG